MTPIFDTVTSKRTTLNALTRPGIIGFHNCVEVTEIIGCPGRGLQPVNILTLLVAEERDEQTLPEGAFLSPRLRVTMLKDWTFGIFRYYRPIDLATQLLDDMPATGTWDFSGNSLAVGKLISRDCYIVPADTYQELPWNRILKNNFWSGSYIFEWHDAQKTLQTNLLTKPRALQELTSKIKHYVPISLASLSDRIGNIIFQIPISILVASFAPIRPNDGMSVEIAWHPKAASRPVRTEVTRRYDGVTAGAARYETVGNNTALPIPDGPGDYDCLIWDETNDLALFVSGPSNFISLINVDSQIADPEPRVFDVGPEHDRKTEHVRVHTRMPIRVGESLTSQVGTWTEKRIYRDEVERLASRRDFVQYKPTSSARESERERALGDIRYLIRTYGEGGAYLWDPYLSATDIINTLFYCPASNVDLRGLTAMRSTEGNDTAGGKLGFIAKQQQIFHQSKSNFRSLRLEFRGRTGSRGWDFHDRFIIFPETNEGPLVWSLGTSVNSLGKQHHILQKVGDAQLVADAFLELWNLLHEPEHLIWRTP